MVLSLHGSLQADRAFMDIAPKIWQIEFGSSIEIQQVLAHCYGGLGFDIVVIIIDLGLGICILFIHIRHHRIRKFLMKFSIIHI